MRVALSVLLALGILLPPLHADPEPGRDEAAEEVVRAYLEASREQQDYLRDVSMDVEIDASLPRLRKSGTLRALRHISRLGQITYRALTFQGDNTVKKDVIARYMTAEVEAAAKTGLGITPENYKFKYYGLYGSDNWQLHLFELTPRKKRVGLFRGWLWIEAKTNMPVREQGEFVKNPSIFLKKVEFVRDYDVRTGVAVPTRIESSVDTRLVGRAELSIRFTNYTRANGDLSRISVRTSETP